MGGWPRRAAVHKPRREASGGTKPLIPWLNSFPEVWEDKSLSHTSVVFCYGNPSKLIQCLLNPPFWTFLTIFLDILLSLFCNILPAASSADRMQYSAFLRLVWVLALLKLTQPNSFSRAEPLTSSSPLGPLWGDQRHCKNRVPSPEMQKESLYNSG